MNPRLLKTTCLLVVAALLATASVGTARAQFPYVPSLPFGHNDAARTIVTAAAVVVAVYFIAKYEASERQREVAEMRAGQSYARMSSKRRASMKAKKVRYIAVDTEKGQKTSSNAKKTVMVWDTQTQKVASNTAYDVEKPPHVGETAKIDSYSAEYVGSGQ